jgi:SAM-dependent methyltransferase
MKYENEFYQVYDALYTDKDYKKECDLVLNYVGYHKNILDVGCGTGIHSSILAAESENVTGIDLSEKMIAVANKNFNSIENLRFQTTSIESFLDLNPQKYDAIISLFNVINHINDLTSLLSFFKCCASLLKEGGVLIFDCWNSVACAIDKPFTQVTEKKMIKGKESKVVYNTAVDLLNSRAEVTIACLEGDIRLKLDDLALWSPRLLTEILKMNKLEPQKLLNFRDFEKRAEETDHRILFIGRKKS